VVRGSEGAESYTAAAQAAPRAGLAWLRPLYLALAAGETPDGVWALVPQVPAAMPPERDGEAPEALPAPEPPADGQRGAGARDGDAAVAASQAYAPDA
jgi:hypothetical protein